MMPLLPLVPSNSETLKLNPKRAGLTPPKHLGTQIFSMSQSEMETFTILVPKCL